ncbi:SDR family NAD(P)-dependent oxidoreductase [Streptomyces sp. NPDC005373]|uniref:SDR family NAD(P)-dependent oxidoreductase n=1 Tax=Streptomyces sp. NPDC005373 TaxID=3156879 RepID=UPI0033AC5D81
MTAHQGRLADTVALVTGGGSGLGLALVDAFSAEGAHVAVLERAPGKAADLARTRPAVEVVVGDATSVADTCRAVDRAVARFGRLTCFIANAGLWDFGIAAADLDPVALDRAFDEIFSVNVKAVIGGALCARPELARTKGSFIVSLSGAHAYPGGGGVLYTASKHAALGVVRQLAYEWAPDVRVNAVAPGVMHSDLRGPTVLGQENQVISDVLPPPGHMDARTVTAHNVTAADYTSAYVLLASHREAPTATGTVVDLTGTRVRGRRDRERIRELARAAGQEGMA